MSNSELLNREMFAPFVAHDQVHITALGGGSGLHHGLLAIRAAFPDAYITAGVTASDDGGSSNKQSRLHDITPVGDARQALVALANNPEIGQLVNKRYDKQSKPQQVEEDFVKLLNAVGQARGTYDHSVAAALHNDIWTLTEQYTDLDGDPLGNLMLVSASRLAGRVSCGIAMVSDLLGIENGAVMPITDDRHRLVLTRQGEPMAVGQSVIDTTAINLTEAGVGYTYNMTSAVGAVSLDLLRTNPAILNALKESDLVFAGPGSVLTSILSAASAPGIRAAIEASSAKRLIVPNVARRAPEDQTWNMANQISAIQDAIGGVDVVVANNNPDRIRHRNVPAQPPYIPLELSPAEIQAFEERNIQVVLNDLVSLRVPEQVANDSVAYKRSSVVHNVGALAMALRYVHAPQKV